MRLSRGPCGRCGGFGSPETASFGARGRRGTEHPLETHLFRSPGPSFCFPLQADQPERLVNVLGAVPYCGRDVARPRPPQQADGKVP